MNLKLLKLARLLHLIDKKTYNKKRHIALIQQSVYFDEKYYRSQFPEQRFADISSAEHYLTQGWHDNKNPSPYFSTAGYLEENPDVKDIGMNPLLHYEISGRKEGRAVIGLVWNNYALTMSKRIFMTITSCLGKFLYRKQIQRNKKGRILVCLHLFYMESWPIIKRYLENLSPYCYDLIVTYIGDNYTQDTLDQVKQFKPNAKFYEYANQGFDIGPFIDVLSKVDLEAYDIVFKIHSKGVGKPFRYVYNQVFKFDNWFYNLFDGVLGGINCHKAINSLLSNKKAGIVSAKNLVITDPKHKQILTHNFAQHLNIQIPLIYHYIAGTMFAAKSECLKPIKSLNLSIDDFAETRRGEFSLAHAVERIICALAEAQGYEILGLTTPHRCYLFERRKLQKSSALRLLEDNRFELDPDFFYKTLELRKIKAYTLEKVKISDIKRKWIDGKLYSLNECAPFLYLSGNKNAYQEYCQVNSETSKFDMSENRFTNLISSLEKGFDERKVPVIHGAQNILMDGQHRLCYLLKKYGESHEITCLHLDIIPRKKQREKKIA
ncbi:MAG: hypothetical protein IJ864_01275 [Alphaproteobacteria bacterium]|nr:hypothetical protein [Alphaproteobacteria bacterium]